MNTGEEDVYVCPSFNSYSSNRLSEIAVRVAAERPSGASGNEKAAGDEDFEFAFVRDGREVLVDEFFNGGELIRPVFPVFDRDLMLSGGGETSTSGGNAPVEPSVAVPLGKLFIEEDHERDYPPSCSSSEADELESLPAGTYCVWRPKMAQAPLPSQCKKSKSTGSASKRWKFRDLLRRSKSDGKDSFVFLTPQHREEIKSEKSINRSPVKANAKASSTASGGATTGSPSAHESFYVRNRAMKEGAKKKSYLPYRQDLVGLFANVNGLPRSFPHF